MTKDLQEIKSILTEILTNHKKVLKFKGENSSSMEASGTIEAMQGKKKVDGIYFASVVEKPKDIRLYFFPIYTHVKDFENTLSDELKKSLKGKSCFHIKAISDEIKIELQQMVNKGIVLFQKDGLLAK